MRLIEQLTADEVREIHFSIFRDFQQDYLRRGPFDVLSQRQVEQRIRNVKDRDIRRNLRAIPEFEAATIAGAWSHHMAVNAGTHLWPDANHRTALTSFSRGTSKGLGLYVAMDVAAARQMRDDSKAMRDTDYLAKGGRYYTVADLANPHHPYRQVYTKYERRLIVVPVGPTLD